MLKSFFTNETVLLILINSLNWILNDNRDQIEKSMLDIEDYLDSMGKTTEKEKEKEKENDFDVEVVHGDGKVDVEFKDFKQLQDKDSECIYSKNCQNFSDENRDEKLSETIQKDESKLLNFFNVKMILIGSAAMMFSKICGNNFSRFTKLSKKILKMFNCSSFFPVSTIGILFKFLRH